MQVTRQIKQIIGENIRHRRDELKLSRRELAIRIGADQTMIYKWEVGKHRPDDTYLAELAQALGKEMVWLLTDHAPESDKAAA